MTNRQNQAEPPGTYPIHINLGDGTSLEYTPATGIEYVTDTEVIRIPVEKAARLGVALTRMHSQITGR